MAENMSGPIDLNTLQQHKIALEEDDEGLRNSKGSGFGDFHWPLPALPSISGVTLSISIAAFIMVAIAYRRAARRMSDLEHEIFALKTRNN